MNASKATYNEAITVKGACIHMSETPALPHQVILDERHRLHITGITDVDNYDDSAVIAQTCAGELTIRGSSLHICKLNIESGDLSIEGHIIALEYAEPRPTKGGRLKRLFK